MTVLSLPQSLSLQDLLSKLGRPFREYELWALCLACLSALQKHTEHPGEGSPCPAGWSLRPRDSRRGGGAASPPPTQLPKGDGQQPDQGTLETHPLV
jgi:hypothetical protein